MARGYIKPLPKTPQLGEVKVQPEPSREVKGGVIHPFGMGSQSFASWLPRGENGEDPHSLPQMVRFQGEIVGGGKGKELLNLNLLRE